MFKIDVLKEQGPVRKMNEDSYIGLVIEINSGEQVAVCAIADGLGGYKGGEIASNIAVTSIREWFCKEYRYREDNEEVLNKVFRRIQDSVQKEAVKRDHFMGTTLTLLIAYEDTYHIYHVGDCRVYHMHNKLERITEDHTQAYRRWQRGDISEEEYHESKEKQMLYSCLGMLEFTMEVEEGEVHVGDSFLLCTDGLHNQVRDDEIYKEIKAGGNVLQRLFNMASSRKEADNITCIYVDVREDAR